MADVTPRVELAYPVAAGPVVPAAAGFALFSALVAAVPEAHGAPWLAVLPLRGRPTRLKSGTRAIVLGSETEVALRLPLEEIPRFLGLRRLVVQGQALDLGAPTVRALVPKPLLRAPMVTIKFTAARPSPGEDDATRMVAAIAERLDALGVTGARVILGARRCVAIHGYRVWGYETTLAGLTPEASLAVQVHGVGGKRRFGCGVFA